VYCLHLDEYIQPQAHLNKKRRCEMTTALKGSVQTTEGNVVPFPSGANELDDVKLPTTGRTAGSVPLNGRLRPNTSSMTNCVPDTLTQKAADPIKSIADIDKVCNFLLSHKRYRDYMMFVVGINFGLRVSDLTRLRFQDLINNDMTFKRLDPDFGSKRLKTPAKIQKTPLHHHQPVRNRCREPVYPERTCRPEIR
jgi:hypothetical protein